MYRDKTLKRYLDDLAAKRAVPGGGSAAALSAGLGVSLMGMVIRFTLGKPAYAPFQSFLIRTLALSERLRRECLRLVDQDIAAYKSGSAARSLAVPLKLGQLCLKGLQACPLLAVRSNPHLASDVAVAATLLEASCISSCYTARINLRSVGLRGRAAGIRKRLDRTITLSKKLRRDTEVSVGKIIGRKDTRPKA